MIQINNLNAPQDVYLKLDGFIKGMTLDIVFTNQLTNESYSQLNVPAISNNSRFTRITLPAFYPTPNPKVEEGLYIVTFNDHASPFILMATRLAFISSVPAFKESSYEAYTADDEAAYNVYIK